MNIDHVAKRVLITGGPGTGKSTLAEELLSSHRPKPRVIFVYDQDEDFSSRFDIEPVRDAQSMVEASAGGGWVCYVPDDWEDKGYGAPDHPGGFAFFCDFVLAYAKQTKGTKLLFVDELDLLMTTGQYPRSAVALWQLGRKAEVDIYYIAGQASRLHNCMRAKTTEIITFNQADPDNVSYLVKNGISLDILAGLGEHGWYSKNLRTGETDSNIKTKTAHVPEPAKAVGTVAEIVKPATARAAKAAL